MKFTDALFRDIEQNKWDIDGFLDQLKSKQIVIWGTGLAGCMIYEALERQQISVCFFADNNKDKIGALVCGKRTLGIDEIPSDAFVIIAANVKYGIHEQLQKESIQCTYIDPVWWYYYDKGKDSTLAELRKNTDVINSVYEMLMDDESRRVFRNVLLHRAVHDIHLIWEVYDEHQYFGNSIVKKAGKNFIDCGAFQGDTLAGFLEQMDTGEDYHYYAFEADRENYEILKKFCEERKLDWVRPINLGVWDKKGQLYFQGGQTTGEVSGKVVEDSVAQGDAIQVDSLDAVLGQVEIDFIKMDIEGAEIRALQGARGCIERNVPILAISAYHELNHLWEVPLLIKEMNKNYDVYFGHHMWNMADTVCYGLPRA